MHYFHQFQLPFKQRMYFIKCESQGSDNCHNFTVCTMFSLLRQEFLHQSSFWLMKNSFINTASS